MITIDTDKGLVTVADAAGERTLPMASAEAFRVVSDAWLRVGWDTKYVYGFSWMGRPVIQLPEDMVRIQEALWRVKPDVIVETGIAHGGSLIFYASLLRGMGIDGRVIGIDIEIRPHNRAAIEAHPLYPDLTLIEGSSVDPAIVEQVKAAIPPGSRVLALLDSNHSKQHVAAELEAYAPMVSPGSYIVATDGIMRQVAGGARTGADWMWNNPIEAAEEFVVRHPDYIIEAPVFDFNEGVVDHHVTYWPRGYIKRLR